MTAALHAQIACDWFGERLTFSCDPISHLVVVHEADGTPCGAFGGFGRQPGSFDTPLDLTLVQPEPHGPSLWRGETDTRCLAVADYGNARVQIFELNGAHVATLDEDLLAIGRPTQVRWQAPFLEVDGLEGARTRIHLAAALRAHAAVHGSVSRPHRAVARESRLVC
jgi:hypothetical protein